jgi:hypothetical protein
LRKTFTIVRTEIRRSNAGMPEWTANCGGANALLRVAHLCYIRRLRARLQNYSAMIITAKDGIHKLGRCTTPELVIHLLGQPYSSWDDGVERCLQYDTPLGTLSFIFAHYRIFFGRPRLKLTGIELDVVRRSYTSPSEPNEPNVA